MLRVFFYLLIERQLSQPLLCYNEDNGETKNERKEGERRYRVSKCQHSYHRMYYWFTAGSARRQSGRGDTSRQGQDDRQLYRRSVHKLVLVITTILDGRRTRNLMVLVMSIRVLSRGAVCQKSVLSIWVPRRICRRKRTPSCWLLGSVYSCSLPWVQWHMLLLLLFFLLFACNGVTVVDVAVHRLYIEWWG